MDEGAKEGSVRGRRIQESDGRERERRRGLASVRVCVCVQARLCGDGLEFLGGLRTLLDEARQRCCTRVALGCVRGGQKHS